MWICLCCKESGKIELILILSTFFLIINQIKYEYITFLVYNTKISDNNAESGKVPRMLF
jgi:hypothetical protein